MECFLIIYDVSNGFECSLPELYVIKSNCLLLFQALLLRHVLLLRPKKYCPLFLVRDPNSMACVGQWW